MQHKKAATGRAERGEKTGDGESGEKRKNTKVGGEQIWWNRKSVREGWKMEREKNQAAIDTLKGGTATGDT